MWWRGCVLPGGPELRAEILPRTLGTVQTGLKKQKSTQAHSPQTTLRFHLLLWKLGFGIVLIGGGQLMVSGSSE